MLHIQLLLALMGPLFPEKMCQRAWFCSLQRDGRSAALQVYTRVDVMSDARFRRTNGDQDNSSAAVQLPMNFEVANPNRVVDHSGDVRIYCKGNYGKHPNRAKTTHNNLFKLLFLDRDKFSCLMLQEPYAARGAWWSVRRAFQKRLTWKDFPRLVAGNLRYGHDVSGRKTGRRGSHLSVSEHLLSLPVSS
jgi:hypothetical protein